MSDLNCPNCGDAVPAQIKTIAMLTCNSCGTTLYLDGARLQNAGSAGVMHDAPMLFDVGDTVHLDGTAVLIMGHARFSYGRGFWEEFWGTDESQNSVWVSIDEGDVVLQYPLDESDVPSVTGRPRVGRLLTFNNSTFTVTEDDEAECIAIKGSFDERLLVGETYRFVNAENELGQLLSGEFWDGGSSWFLGRWYDPFDIKVDRAP